MVIPWKIPSNNQHMPIEMKQEIVEITMDKIDSTYREMEIKLKLTRISI